MKKKKSSGKGKKIWLIVLAVFLGIGLIEYIVNPDAYKTEPTPAPTPTATATPVVAESATPEPTPVSMPAETPYEVQLASWTDFGDHYMTYGKIGDASIDVSDNTLTLTVDREENGEPFTLDQNFYNVAEAICNQGANQFSGIAYNLFTAKANYAMDFALSFYVPGDVIQQIYNREVTYETMGDKIVDLMVIDQSFNQ